MKILTVILSLFSLYLYPCAIVFVHLGKNLPRHIPYTLLQASRFNPDCPIYLIGEADTLQKLPLDCKAIRVPCESLPITAAHKEFRKKSKLDRRSAHGLWYYSTERFFYLEEFMRSRNLTDVFHLENDVLLYADLKQLLPFFQRHYQNSIGATFENDYRCVPGFLYISEPEPLSRLNEFLGSRTGNDDTDMMMIGLFKKMNPNRWIDYLPILSPEYIADHTPLATSAQVGTEDSNRYANHFEDFGAIFDAAAFGIYMAGDDSEFHITMPGRIHPHSLFDPSHFQIAWEFDDQNRRYPTAKYKESKVRINNLHITNKVMIPDFVMAR